MKAISIGSTHHQQQVTTPGISQPWPFIWSGWFFAKNVEFTLPNGGGLQNDVTRELLYVEGSEVHQTLKNDRGISQTCAWCTYKWFIYSMYRYIYLLNCCLLGSTRQLYELDFWQRLQFAHICSPRWYVHVMPRRGFKAGTRWIGRKWSIRWFD